MRNNKIRNNLIYPVWVMIVVVLALFILIPLLLVVLSAGKSDFVSVISSKVWHQAMINTAIECVCSSSLSVLIGFIYAYAIIKGNFPFKKFFRIVPLIHLITPPFVGGLAFILLLGRQGFITNHILGLDVSIYGFWGLLIAQTLCFFPMAYLICIQTLQGINSNLEKAAKSMGASNFKIFWTVTLPLSFTGILSALLFIAVSVLSDFGNPLIVAGRFRVLAVEIYTQLTGWLNVGTSAVLGIVLIIPSVILFVFQNKLMKKNNSKTSTIGGKVTFNSDDNSDSCGFFTNILLFIFVLVITFAILAQFLAIVAGSFQKLWGINTSFTLDHIKSVLKYSKELMNSLFFSFVAAAISTLFAVVSAYFVYRTDLPFKKFIDTFTQIPSAIPGSLLGLAISITANKIHFRASGVLIIIAMSIAFLPFAYKAIAANYAQIKMSMDDAARALGANQLYLLKTVIAPLSENSIMSGFIYSFIRGVGTVSAVIFLVSFNTPLASVRILNLAEQAFWGKAAALALVLTFITFVILGLGVIFIKIVTGDNHGKSIKS